MHDIFISYSRKDEIFARLLATDLDRIGTTIWIDQKNILPSMPWLNEIEKGLKESSVMLVIVSPDSMVSREVANEWQQFLQSNKPIIPILWRKDTMPQELDRLNHINFETQNYPAAFNILKTTLVQLGVNLSGRHESCLNRRDDLLPGGIESLAAHASTLSILSVSSVAFTDEGHYQRFLENKVKQGCDVSIIMLDPNNSRALKNWSIFSNREDNQTKRHLKKIRDVIHNIKRVPVNAARITDKYLDFYFPFNLFGVNLNATDNSGLIVLGFYAFDRAGGAERPHLLLRQGNDNHWFDFYRQQFEMAWDKAHFLP